MGKPSASVSRRQGRILAGSIAGFTPGSYRAIYNGTRAIANVNAAGILAEQHRRMAEPGSAPKADE